MLWQLSRRDAMRTYSRVWVRYGELWQDFRRCLYWWGSIKELRKLALIAVLVGLQVRDLLRSPLSWCRRVQGLGCGGPGVCWRPCQGLPPPSPPHSACIHWQQLSRGCTPRRRPCSPGGAHRALNPALQGVHPAP